METDNGQTASIEYKQPILTTYFRFLAVLSALGAFAFLIYTAVTPMPYGWIRLITVGQLVLVSVFLVGVAQFVEYVAKTAYDMHQLSTETIKVMKALTEDHSRYVLLRPTQETPEQESPSES